VFSLSITTAQTIPQREWLVWSPDGTQIAAVLSEEVVIWDATTQSVVQRIQTLRPGDHIRRLSWSPDNRLALAFTDMSIGIWDTTDGQLITYLEIARGSQDYRVHQEPIVVLQWSADGQYLVSGASAEGYAVWNMRDYTLHNQIYTYDVRDLIFIDNENFILAMSAITVVHHVNIEESTPELFEILFDSPFQAERTGDVGSLNMLRYNTSKELLMAATYAGDVLIWDIEKDELIQTFSIDEGFPWESEVVTINDDMLIFIEEDQTVQRYNIFTGEQIETNVVLEASRAAGWSPLGGRIAYLTSGTSGDEIQLEIDVVFSQIEDIQRLLSVCEVEDEIESGIGIDELLEQLPIDAHVTCTDEITALVNAYNGSS